MYIDRTLFATALDTSSVELSSEFMRLKNIYLVFT